MVENGVWAGRTKGALESVTGRGGCTIAIERVTESDLLERYGLRISRRGVLLGNLNPTETAYIQTYPTISGPDPRMNRFLWHHLARRENWIRTEWPPASLKIEIHRVTHCASPSPDLSVPGQPRSALEAKYSEWLWTFHPLPAGKARLLVPGSMYGDEPSVLRYLEPEWQIVTLDLSEIHCGRMRAAGLSVCAGNLVALPFRDGTFDLVYNNNVIEHVAHVENMLSEIARVLRPGGRFVFVVPTDMNEANPHASVQWEFSGPMGNMYLVNPDVAWKTDLHDLYHRLSAAGFARMVFAYREEDLRRHSHLLERRRRRGRISRGLERGVEAVEGNPTIREMEAWLRRRLGNYHRWTGWKRWLRTRLRLPDRLAESLNVLVAAQKVARESR